jgi:23S rRNA pseudouridine1911/1915/1917 synthase
MLVQGDETGDSNLMDEVKAFLKERDKKPGNVFLGLVHRLDRPVGGVTLFAKTSKGASRLSDQFRTRSVKKVYWAVVEGTPKKKRGSVVQWLRKDEANNFVHAFDHEVSDSFKAELNFTVLKSAGGKSLVEVIPTTGRPHQIRVAMASLGTPIVGDLKYGAKTKLYHDIALFARALSFNQPVTDERITVTVDPILDIFNFSK